MGIKVLPPDVNESYSDYAALGDDIRFGLSAIRNVGENVTDSIVRSREIKGRYQDFHDFLHKVDQQVCNKKTIESLIKAGAFDSLNHARKGLMMVFTEAIDAVTETKKAEAIGQFDLFGGGEESGGSSIAHVVIPSGEWEKSLLLANEREMLGLYVSDHPLLGVEHLLRAAVDVPISALTDEGVGHDQVVSIGGLITQVQRKVSKQGNAWAIVTVEDLAGAIDVMFFAGTYASHAMNLIEDQLVVIRGRVDKREDAIRFTALEMSLPDVSAGPAGPLIISIPPARLTPPVVERMKEILSSHPGEREVHLRLEDEKEGVLMRLEVKVSASPSLSADLKQALGADCVIAAS